MSRFLRLKSLKLRNFKGIAELDLELDQSLTLLAGVNGVGKTSVMEALLAVATDTWIDVTGGGAVFSFQENVVRAGAKGAKITLGLDISRASPIEIEWKMDGTGLRLDGGSSGYRYVFREFMPLPLLVYYEQNRVVRPNSSARHVSVSSKENQASSLQAAYSSPQEFKAWYFEKEADEGQEVRDRRDVHYEDPELALIRGLLTHLDGFEAIRSRKTSDSSERTLFLEKDGADIPFDSLSGGEQAFFLLIADLARRLMLACPNTPLAEVPAIVCIDEIELHLHPAWQKRILRTLMEIFPACQFVVSTHSPQVISGVEARHVRLLTPLENGVREVSPPRASKGRDSNYVLKVILGTPERADDISQLFAKFDELVDADQLEDAERVLDQLDEAVEGQSSEVAIRQAKWNRRRRTAE